MKKTLYAFFIFAIFSLTGCGNVVDEGNIAVKSSFFTGQYEDGFVNSGWHFAPTTHFSEIDAREMVIPVTTEAKDSEGVQMPVVTVEMRVKIKNYDGVVPALRSNLRIEPGNLLGVSRLISDGKVSLRQVADKMKAEQMFSDNAAFAKKLVDKYQEVLDTTYPSLFAVTQVNVLKVDVPEFIQGKISSVAARSAEIERNNATIASIESRKTLQSKEAQLVADYMKHSGISSKDYVEMEKVKMIREIFEDAHSSDNQRGGKGSSSTPTMIINLTSN